jgi:hypothetical protein
VVRVLDARVAVAKEGSGIFLSERSQNFFSSSKIYFRFVRVEYCHHSSDFNYTYIRIESKNKMSENLTVCLIFNVILTAN